MNIDKLHSNYYHTRLHFPAHAPYCTAPYAPQVLHPMPDTFTINPIMNSKGTRINPGSGAPADWRNMFGKLSRSSCVQYTG